MLTRALTLALAIPALLLGAIGLATLPAQPAQAHTAHITGEATCLEDGTYSIAWSVRTGSVPGNTYGEAKVIVAAPSGSLVNGATPTVWLFEWPKHAANNGLQPLQPNSTFGFTQTGIPGTATGANVMVQIDWKDGYSHDPTGSVVLDGTCSPPPPPPVEVRVLLTYMTECAPDADNTWRVRNPSAAALTVAWRNASGTLSGTHEAAPGDTFFTTPRSTETMVVTWGGGETGIVAGQQTKASGNDLPSTDPKCAPVVPEKPKVEVEVEERSSVDCEAALVHTTVTTTTTDWVLVDNRWVKGEPSVVEQHSSRPATAEECPPVETEPPTDPEPPVEPQPEPPPDEQPEPLAYTGADTAGMLALVLALLGAGATLVVAARLRTRS